MRIQNECAYLGLHGLLAYLHNIETAIKSLRNRGIVRNTQYSAMLLDLRNMHQIVRHGFFVCAVCHLHLPHSKRRPASGCQWHLLRCQRLAKIQAADGRSITVHPSTYEKVFAQ